MMIRNRLIFMSTLAVHQNINKVGSMGETLVNHIAKAELTADFIPGLSDSELEEYFLDNVHYFYGK